ncbi:CBS domain-containing protein [Desulfonatronum thioautotrophicum]|uniref:CBS domain-containing protein n=1 Tax=Desulfonatronum thioautotrophicum TaxID=617001 RepID=UPI0005EAE999|nr:CBS domain-containing protein [Desulfonatronum thioautotrophicum]
MQEMTIRNLMRPTEDFPRIPIQATFSEAMEALRRAQEAFLEGRQKQRILLVEDPNGVVLGKLSPMDLVRGLEPRYDKIDSIQEQIQYGVPHLFQSMKDDFRLWHEPLADMCRKAREINIETFLNKPDPDHTVAIDDELDKAFHLFVTTRHDSLYVMDGERIIGLLRFSDVYKAICEVATSCALDDSPALTS